MARRRLVAGNWKMNGLSTDLAELDAIVADVAADGAVAVAVCPPFTLVAAAAARSGAVAVGGQDCHAAGSGAHTGETSAAMLRDAGASCVIVGHSERRQDAGETDAAVRAKATAAIAAGLMAILCVGETEAERDAGAALATVERQLEGSVPPDATARQLVIAYEPVWAIGTGRTPSTGEVGEMHGAVRATLRRLLGAEAEAVRILYGGSVKPANAAALMAVADVDGALVGGASLTAADFLPIVAAARAAARA